MDAELKKKKEGELAKTSDLSFDHARFREDMGRSDAFSQVIKAQLYLEHILIEALNDEFKEPGAAELRRIGFNQKLDLCIALGLLRPDMKAAIAKVNEMRNRLAHRLDADADAEALRTELGGTLPEYIWLSLTTRDGMPVSAREDQRLSDLFTGVVVWSEIYRRQAMKNRIEHRYTMLEAAETIEGLRKELAELKGSSAPPPPDH